MGKLLQISVNIIFSPYDDAMGGGAILRSKEEVIDSVIYEVIKCIKKNIPSDYACSLVIADKIVNSVDELNGS